jgi:microcystin-dependent protein
MPDTYTSTLGAILMGIGGDNNTWGTNLNASVIQILEDAIANRLTVTQTSGTLDLSANAPPLGPSAARFAVIVIIASLTGNLTIKVPALDKRWLVFNNAGLNGFSIAMTTPTGTPVALPSLSGPFEVFCSGAGNTLVVSPFTWQQVQGPNGAAAAPFYSFLNETNSGWYRNGTQDIRLAVNGADVLQVTGAGASSPSVVNILSPESLQVAGTSVGTFTTGDVKLTFKTAADPGWVMMDDSTLGDASSNATHASAANSALFQLLYNNISDADAPILTSGGAATTRGAQGSAATAFANHCRLTLPLTLGRALAAAGSGAGLTARTLGHALGEETHTLSTPEMPAHTHANPTINDPGHTHTLNGSVLGGGGSGAQGGSGDVITSGSANSHTTGITLNSDQGSAGGGGSHNNMQPSTFLNVMIKL